MAEAAQNKQVSNLTQRLITAAVALPPVLVLILLGGIPFKLMVGVVGVVACLELSNILRGRPTIFVFSLFYVAVPLLCLVILRDKEQGLAWMAVIISITWVTDAMSYVGGRLFGKTPLSPAISPGKTVEGAITGYLCGAVATILTLGATGLFNLGSLFLALLGPIAAIVGDLFESFIKRRFHVKDSHLPGLNILPGHGGIMDRIDGLLFVCVLCFLYTLLAGI